MTIERSMESAIRPLVEAGQLAGASAVLWRDEEVRGVAMVGVRDLVARSPVERNTIFRIASMSKPVTTVADAR